ncbi:hypothetical protein [Pseudomonas serbica]|uniref:hypothetical protein n=1 Tax=Pseudomonas serbica TaxID=2965074 RepID=UPI00237A7715|nr:hypothetical protein [Pseudomonas serbica]
MSAVLEMMDGRRNAGMSQSHDDIVNFIEMLHKDRHLIAQAYCDGKVTLTDTNLKAVRRLQQFRVMRPDGSREDTFRLGPSLSKHLDEVFRRHRNFSVSINFGEQSASLSKLVEEYSNARDEGRTEDQENYLSDFDAAVFELSEEASNLLMRVRTLTDNNFANVKTHAEKLRQNEYYLAQMNRIDAALTDLQSRDFLDLLESSLTLEPLNTVYYRHIVDNLSEWRAILLDITSVLKAFLEKTREIQPKARRIRAMALFLQKNPGYQPRDVEEYPYIPEWAYLHGGIAIAPWPDMGRDDITENLIEVARSIPSLTAVPSRQRSAGVLLDDEQKRVVEIQVTPIQAAIINYLRTANESKKPISAREFLANDPLLSHIEPKISLLCLMSTLDNHTNAGAPLIAGLTIERHLFENDDPRSGNLQVEDISAWKRV